MYMYAYSVAVESLTSEYFPSDCLLLCPIPNWLDFLFIVCVSFDVECMSGEYDAGIRYVDLNMPRL